MTELVPAEGYTTAERSSAARLDDDIRTAISELRGRWEDLQALLEKAQQSQLHVILGYRSWTAYVFDIFGETGPVRLAKTDRTKAIVEMTDELGMPARAIAAVLGVSPITVSKVARANGAGNKAITGMNGATYMPAVLRKKRTIPPPVALDDVPVFIDDAGEEVPPPDDTHKLTLMAEAKRINGVLSAVASELSQLERRPGFSSRRRYVMAELRPGIVRLYEQVQGMSSE